MSIGLQEIHDLLVEHVPVGAHFMVSVATDWGTK